MPVTAPTNLPTAQQPQKERSYYDHSFLKPPVWKWEIASYFFMGGLSSGAYLISRMAERFGGRKYRDVTRLGTLLSFTSLLACPPLLIADLGDPKRFHHMLRVWKPGTPMNLGSWTLTGYGAAASAALLREWAKNRPARDRSILGSIAAHVRATDGVLMAVTDAAGVPLALLMTGYTGVLLSCTANPMWCKNPWLGPLFSASSIGTGASGIGLLLSAAGHDPDSPSHKAIEKIDTVAHVAEAACLAGYVKHARVNAKPLTEGKYKKHLHLTIGGLIASELLKFLPLAGSARRLASILSSFAGLASAYSLRWAMVYAGHDAAKDPKLAQNVSKPRSIAGPEFAGTQPIAELASGTSLVRPPDPFST